MQNTMTTAQLLEITIPQLNDKRTHFVRVPMANGTFELTERNNTFVSDFYGSDADMPDQYNVSVLHGYRTVVARP